MGLEEKTQTREIDGFTYRVTPLGFGLGKAVLMRVLHVLAPVLAAGAGRDTAWGQGAAILGALPAALTEKDLDFFAQKFGDASHFQAPGQAEWVPLVDKNQEMHFAVRYPAFIAWILFSLEVNYSGFFVGDVLKNAVAGLRTLTTPKA